MEQRGTGADVRFRVAPSGDSADRYTTKEGKKVGFSSRLGKLALASEIEIFQPLHDFWRILSGVWLNNQNCLAAALSVNIKSLAKV